MIHQLIQAFKGFLTWKHLVRKYNINDRCVVIVLPEDDDEWNECALKYLPSFMKRKSANRSLVIFKQAVDMARTVLPDSEVGALAEEKIRFLMQYYLLWKFFPGIVFFYRSFPRDNITEQILSKSRVTIEELICLGFYRLREVPSDV